MNIATFDKISNIARAISTHNTRQNSSGRMKDMPYTVGVGYVATKDRYSRNYRPFIHMLTFRRYTVT